MGKRPLWQHVQEDLQRRIEAGDFADGFPGELALAAEYEVSRATVRRALGPLRTRGVVSAQRGRASEVSSLAGRDVYGPLYSLFVAVEKSGMEQRNRVLAAQLVQDVHRAAKLGEPDDAHLVYVSRIRLADGEPIAFDEAWFVPEAAGILAADLERVALYDALISECGIRLTSGQDELRAIQLDESQAELLETKPGTAAFKIERRSFSEGRPIELRCTVARGDKFTITTTYP